MNRRTSVQRARAAERFRPGAWALVPALFPIERARGRAFRPQVVAGHRPLAAAALVHRAGGGPVGGAERRREERDATGAAEDARDGATRHQEDVRRDGAGVVDAAILFGGLLGLERLLEHV